MHKCLAVCLAYTLCVRQQLGGSSHTVTDLPSDSPPTETLTTLGNVTVFVWRLHLLSVNGKFNRTWSVTSYISYYSNDRTCWPMQTAQVDHGCCSILTQLWLMRDEAKQQMAWSFFGKIQALHRCCRVHIVSKFLKQGKSKVWCCWTDQT